ncbi:GMPR2 reductase, partial [Polyodon spathula]|nr:GMPR2 reductase [Polyodon spathula]
KLITMPRVDADLKLDFKDVLLKPKRSSLKSRSEVALQRTFTFRNSKQTYTGIPIIAANMDTTGTFEMAQVLTKHTLFIAVQKHYSVEEWKKFAVNFPECLEHMAASSGSGKADLEKLCSILEAVPQIKYICLDVANGYSEHFVEFVKTVRGKFPTHTIMAGNVVTGEMVEELILSGADIIKVGIGPGSVCTTRIKTGVGYPQLSAVMECSDSAHGLKGHIISTHHAATLELQRWRTMQLWAAYRQAHRCLARPQGSLDGGCSCPGDVAKAFGAGADFVMLGGMFAGHGQCAGEVIEKNGKKMKLFYGMSSNTAMKKYVGGVAEYSGEPPIPVPYRASGEGLIVAGNIALQFFVFHKQTVASPLHLYTPANKSNPMASEGRTVEVPYRGDVENTIRDILGGLRSTCTYVGAAKLKELSQRTTFIRVTQQSSHMFS